VLISVGQQVSSKKFDCWILKLCKKQKFRRIGEQTAAARSGVFLRTVSKP